MREDTEPFDEDEPTDGCRFPDLRADFARHLSICNDENFILLIFGQNALQLGHVDLAKLILRAGFSRQFENANFPTTMRANEWELETIINEFLTTSSTYRYVYADHPRLNHLNSASIIHIINILRDLENEEYAYYDHDIRYELRRIVNRQFEWQRGFFNKTLAYRTAIMYGGPECEDFLQASIGLSLDEITFGAFALTAAFQNFAQVDRRLPTEHVGLAHPIRDAVFDLFSADLADVRRFARQQRQNHRTTAYRPSVLRKYPCIRRSDNDRLMLCPLPQLIMARATTGIYYDVVPGGGPIRNEVGRRFEGYCFTLLQRSFPANTIEREFAYRVTHRQDSPDILISHEGRISQVYECKAVRMSFADRFAEAEFVGRGYDEIAKAIVQIWRFASDCRRGRTGRHLTSEPLGIVILLDSWMTMVLDARQDVFARAEVLAAANLDLAEVDKIPILFTEIGDLESVVLSTDFATYTRILTLARKSEFDGWLLSSIFERDEAEPQEKVFPFEDLPEVVPWWGRITRMKDRRGRSSF